MRPLVLIALCAACDNGTTNDMSCMVQAETGTTCAPAYSEDVSACTPLATDYQPRAAGVDPWPACISDDNTFHLVGTSAPASAARTNAFESMALKLWDNPNTPTPDDFLSARDDYSVAQGLGSRVERRQDVHHPETPGDDKFACSNAGVPAMYPDRCAGPAKLLPIINDAFQKGIACNQPRVQAARLEAALLWFFYLSTLSEVWTCGFDDILDCDAVWGYFNGANPRNAPKGLGRYINALGPETYNRAFDAVLAERCWRDLDQAQPATDKTHEQQAQDQLDAAEIRGLALIARQRFNALSCSTGERREAHFAFLQVLIGFMDRASRVIDANQADVLKAQIGKTAATVDVAAASAALDALYACP